MNHKNQTNNYTDFFYYTFRNILLVGIPLVIIFALILSIPHSSATFSGASADSLTLSLPTSCTLSSVVNSAHNATLISGTYTSDIGKTTITTLCNDGNGYAIYANGLSNGTVGNNALISSVSSNHNIATGIYEQGDTTSSWAMKLGNVSGDTSPTPPVIEQGYNNTYGLVPNTWTKVAGRTSGTTDMITGSTFTTTYAVYTAPTQHAGTYTGQVAYVLIHGSGDGSGFNMRYMQDIANWKNELSNPGDATIAIDIRDGKWYWVARLADGNIWMTQNLDLDLIANHTYTHNDTDLGWSPNNFDDNATWTLTSGPSTIAWDSASATYPGWQNSDSLPYSTDPGDKYYYTSGSTEDDIVYNSISECINAGHTDCKHYSVGNYYNFTAAIASNNSTSLTSGNAPNSVCPAGWRLPSASSNYFGILLKDYNITTSATGTGGNNPVNYSPDGFERIRTAPLYFVRSIFTGGDSKYGDYLYSTVTNSHYNTRLHFDSNTVNLTNGTYRYAAFSIRCIAR